MTIYLILFRILKTIYENKIQNQSSLFLDDIQKISYLMQDKNLPNWTSNEILSKEFESVGFYLSNHPLERFQRCSRTIQTQNHLKILKISMIESFCSRDRYVYKRKKNSERNSFCNHKI